MQSLESLLLVRRVVRKGQSKASKESYGRLFNEPFVPAWQLQQQSEANYELADFIKSCNKAFRQDAIKSMVKIMSTTDNSCNYSNPS